MTSGFGSIPASGSYHVDEAIEIQSIATTTTVAVHSFEYAKFEAILASFSLKINGDSREQAFCTSGLDQKFPNYESMWRCVIVPATGRVTNSSLQLRPDNDASIKTLCQFHYSMLRSLLLADSLITLTHDGSMEQFIMHLENALEQAELFLLFWVLCLVHPKNRQLRKIDLGNVALTKRKDRSNHLSREFGCKQWSKLSGFRVRNQKIRDALLHGPVPLFVYDSSGLRYPDFETILARDPWKNAQFWGNLTESNGEINPTVYPDQVQLKSKHFDRLVSEIDAFWKSILPSTKKNFYLRESLKLYNLNITSVPRI